MQAITVSERHDASASDKTSERRRVGLLVTCLVDLFRPVVGFATIRLLEREGFAVVIPEAQTCCGQPAYNSGDATDAAKVASGILDVFEDVDFVVAPSGSCASMLRHDYPRLFASDPKRSERARALASKTYELVQFLTSVCGVEALPATFPKRVGYHDSCSALRGLGLSKEPRRLLENVAGLELCELSEPEVCCGFGGTFCVKYADISTEMVERKVATIRDSGAEVVTSCDMGCLLNIAGRLRREGAAIQVRHIAEILADLSGEAGIGEPSE